MTSNYQNGSSKGHNQVLFKEDLDESSNNGAQQPSEREQLLTKGGYVEAATVAKRFNWQRINDTPIWWFLAIVATMLIAIYTDNLPGSLLGGFAVAIVLGGLLSWIGNLVPYARHFGLPTLLCTFVPATLVLVEVMPENVITVMTDFMDTVGFLDFIVAAIITGAVLGMPRKLLVKAGPRFVVPLAGCIALTLLALGGIGFITGRGFLETMLFIAAPAMAGGLGVGAIPMSEMYAQELGMDVGTIFAQLMAVTVLANAMTIVFAGVLNGIRRAKPNLFNGFNGNGQMMQSASENKILDMPPKKASATFLSLGKGLMITAVLYVLATTINGYLPFLHEFAWLIIVAALLKILGLFPNELEESASEWGDLMTTYFVPTLLVGVSIAYIKLSEVIDALTDPGFLLLVIATVLCSGLSAGLLGYLVKFHFIEAAVIPGLVMADSGGSGDVQVLSAANLIHLMPFAALATRLGGALTLFLAAITVPFLTGAF